jgi:ABC-type dipeptide/oligopeptide/nickel transport system permease component
MTMLVHCLRVFAACANFVRFQIAESMGKYYVTTKRTKDTKNWEIYYISIS